jgi:hypothetical protein
MITKSIKIKLIVVFTITILFSLINTYLLHNKFTVDTIITALVCILPITFLVKFKEQK